MARTWTPSDPPSLEAACTRSVAEWLVRYDHYRAVALGTWGVLVTLPWLPMDGRREVYVLSVVLNPSPRHLATEGAVRSAVFGHPAVPDDVQRLLDRLAFRPAATPGR